jgi:hypothetical protein
MGREREKRNVTVLSRLVPVEFHQAQKDTRHQACNILYVNTTLYLRTVAIDGSDSLLYLKMKEEDRSLTNDDREVLGAILLIELSSLVSLVQSFGAT